MSDKLDQSLDQILATRRTNGGAGGRGRGGRRVPSARKSAIVAPTGGVQKKTKDAAKPKDSKKPTANGKPSTGIAGVDTKIIVSNLPRDIDDKQIQEYFSKTIGPIKRVWLEYGPNGQSRGRATILFSKPGDGNKALNQLNGIAADGKPMKIEVVVDATRAASGSAAAPKSLGDRIANPKTAATKPKSAAPKKDKSTTDKVAPDAARGAKAGRGTKRGRAAGRPKKKTADQLDAEMTDYFNTTGEAAPAAGNTNAAPAADVDTGMDEVS